MCKHIHNVCKYVNENGVFEDRTEGLADGNQIQNFEVDDSTIQQRIVDTVTDVNAAIRQITPTDDDLFESFQNLKAIAKTDDSKIAILRSLKRCFKSVTAIENREIPLKKACKTTKTVPANKNITKQRENCVLYSTKKKHKNANEQKRKPNQGEKEAILSDVFLKPKSIMNKPNDKKATE